MMRSLTEEHMAPGAPDKGNVPCRGILCSGLAMLAALRFGLFFPRVYLFLISSGGFALLFSYVVIMATHIRFRRENGCPPAGKCQMRGFPYTSFFVLISLVAAIAGMPFVPGQLSGLAAGAGLVAFIAVCYAVMRYLGARKRPARPEMPRFIKTGLAEFSEELVGSDRDEDRHE
jgi:L-asparagine transporter-like permease